MTDRILIIEDEEKIARFIELELVHEGYEVVKCGDGRTGLEQAESGGFSLVLLDIMLPELNGMEVLRRLRRTSDVPVIMLTARDAVMDKVAIRTMKKLNLRLLLRTCRAVESSLFLKAVMRSSTPVRR